MTDLTDDCLEQVVELASHAYDLPLSALSKGEQFRVELARGLVSGSVVDEFTSNTDRFRASEKLGSGSSVVWVVSIRFCNTVILLFELLGN